MEFDTRRIKIRDVVDGYVNNDEEGVVGYGGNLNIRPKYQREFVYDEKQRGRVIDSIREECPIGEMYWSDNEDGTFEVIDGQQRTLSIAEYVDGNFSINHQFFHNLTEDEQNQILDYELVVHVCKGTDREKLNWYQRINIAGEKHTEQELRNSVYTGPWLTHAKRHFSKTGCPAWDIGKNLVKGSLIRQDFLETAIKWVSDGNIEEYMSEHQHDNNADALWTHFQDVTNWVNLKFEYRKEMKGQPWGSLYREYCDHDLDKETLEEEIKTLMKDDDVTKQTGIYEYILSRDPKHLNIRGFEDRQKRQMYETQDGVCPSCEDRFEIEQMEADHITPWSEGGKTELDNGQMLCKRCNRTKSNS